MTFHCIECGRRVPQVFRGGEWRVGHCAVHPNALRLKEPAHRKRVAERFALLRAAVSEAAGAVEQQRQNVSAAVLGFNWRRAMGVESLSDSMSESTKGGS